MYKFSNSVCCAVGGVCIINMANSVEMCMYEMKGVSGIYKEYA